jgi:hypothetical protein
VPTNNSVVVGQNQIAGHLSLAKDAPTPRLVQGVTEGDVIVIREVGGLHHRDERRAA